MDDQMQDERKWLENPYCAKCRHHVTAHNTYCSTLVDKYVWGSDDLTVTEDNKWSCTRFQPKEAC